MKIIIKSKKFGERVILIDDNDFDKIKYYSLSLFKNKDRLYVRTSWINGKRYLLHRYLTNAPDDKQVDHINHNTLDNRVSTNLRLCTHSENMRNSLKHKKSIRSPYKGVATNNNSIYAFITINKVQKRLGSYKTHKDAAAAYNEAAVKHFGQFACLNIID